MIWGPLVLLFTAAQVDTAESIMARVAENQDRAEAARAAFVYHQSVLVRMNHTNGKLAAEQYSEFTVTPTEHGIQKVRTLFLGKQTKHGKVVEFATPEELKNHVLIDGNVSVELGDGLANDKASKDGISRELFPLTAKEQRKYVFRLEGSEDYRGRRVYRISFEPGKGKDEDSVWAGEALIDTNEYQPVLITTHQSFKMPFLVKTALGTNLEHLGFKVTYKKFDEGLWFPVSYGGELRVRALFFYARTVGISIQNSGFAKADVHSSVTFTAQ